MINLNLINNFRNLKLEGPFSGIFSYRQTIILFIIGSICMAQAMGVIYTKQTRRLLHAKLQAMYTARDKLQIEWSKLLLEQGTWQANARVERIAREHLGMVVPDKINVITP